MDNLKFEDILTGLREGEFEPSYIIDLLKNNQLNYLYDDEIVEIGMSFERDEDKIALVKYLFSPRGIIETLKSEESIVKAIAELDDDEQKVKIALRYLTNDKNRIEAIKTITNEEEALPIKLSLSREAFKSAFLREEDQQYHEFGLDENITIGIEIESLGKKSGEILATGKKNGTIEDKQKGMESGKLVMRRN